MTDASTKEGQLRSRVVTGSALAMALGIAALPLTLPDFWLSFQFLFGLVIGGANAPAGALISGLFLQFAPDPTAAIGQSASLVLHGMLFVIVGVAMPAGMAGAAGWVWRRACTARWGHSGGKASHRP